MRSKLRAFLELIKFEHTVFALPFAYLGMLLASGGRPSWRTFAWVTLAMVSARTAGMTLNRIADRSIDAANPRTKNRPSVTGEIPMRFAWGAALVSLAILFLSAAVLNPLCLKLAPVAVVLLSGYHFVKRFHWLCHFALGSVLAIAPVGGWIAVTGRFSWTPVLLGLAVLFWTAGFDILYALLDVEFDRTHGLHSIPAQFGTKRAMTFSRACHAATIIFLVFFGIAAGLGWVYWAGAAVVAGLLAMEHRIAGEGELSRINTAFFNVNGWIGILLLIFTFLDIFR